jgi:caa(3)-type oxidase subunit IV
VKRTVVVLVVLVALALLSLGASYVGLGTYGLAVALAIAATKAGLVAHEFMELRQARPTVRLVAAVIPLFVAILTFFVAADVVAR